MVGLKRVLGEISGMWRIVRKRDKERQRITVEEDFIKDLSV